MSNFLAYLRRELSLDAFGFLTDVAILTVCVAGVVLAFLELT